MAADAGQVVDPPAADQLGDVPARQLLPERPLPVLREKVGRGLQFLGEVGPHVGVFDAGAAGRVAGQGEVRVADEDRDLPDAAHVGQLREGERHPRPPRLHRRGGRGGDRGEPRGERLHRRHHSLPRRSRRGLRLEDRAGPGQALRVVDAVSECRRDEVHEVVDDEITKRRRQQGVAQAGLGDHGDLGAVPLRRVAAGQDRDRQPDEVERITGGVGRVVSLVDPAQLVQVVEIARELVEVERWLERHRPVGHVEGEHLLEIVRLGERVGVGNPAAVGRLLQGQGHAQKRLVAPADGGLAAGREFAQLPLHLGLVFVAVPHEAALPPHIGLLGHDRAVGVDMVLQPVDLVGQSLDGVPALGLRAVRGGGLPVGGPHGSHQAVDHAADVAGPRRQGGPDRQGEDCRDGHRPTGRVRADHGRISFEGSPVRGAIPHVRIGGMGQGIHENRAGRGRRASLPTFPGASRGPSARRRHGWRGRAKRG